MFYLAISKKKKKKKDQIGILKKMTSNCPNWLYTCLFSVCACEGEAADDR